MMVEVDAMKVMVSDYAGLSGLDSMFQHVG
jgi:vancomycin permeability regulator SanA